MSVTKVTSMMSTGTKGGDISSASTLVIDTDGDFFDITGTTGITAMTVDAGRRFTLQFDGAVVLTHGSSLYLPGATNFTTEANDSLEFIATAANTVRCTGFALKNGGSPVAAAGGKILQVQSSFDGTGGQTTTRNTWAEIGTSVTLTPAATSSTILLFSKANGYLGGGSGYALLYYSIQRTLSGTATDDVSTKTDLYLDARSTGTLFGQTSANVTTLGKDSPSTTSQLTYQAQYYTNGVNYSGTVGVYNIDLIAMEVGA